jgi:hypothetical protein
VQPSLLDDAGEARCRAMQRAEIHRRLHQIAPGPGDDGSVTAAALATFMAGQAQVQWTQHISNGWASDAPLDVGAVRLMTAQYAAAHALQAIASATEQLAALPAKIRDAWEDGGGVGEHLFDILGKDTTGQIAELATKLQELDRADAPAALMTLGQMLAEFHTGAGSTLPHAPTGDVPPGILRGRVHLMRGEWRELLDAMEEGDPAKVAKEGCDLVYAIAGTLLYYGVPVDTAMAAVHQSNMTKVVPGRVTENPDGKIPKGPFSTGKGGTGNDRCSTGGWCVHDGGPNHP